MNQITSPPIKYLRFSQFLFNLSKGMTSRERRGELILEGEGTNYKDKVVYYEGVNLVGRNPLKTAITIKDRSISDIHGKIICRNNIIKIVDMQSKNGMYLNSLQDQIEANSQIQINPSKDIVYFAQIKCRFQADSNKGQIEEDTKEFTVKANIGQELKIRREEQKNNKEEEIQIIKKEQRKGEESKETKVKQAQANTRRDEKQTKKQSAKQKKQKQKQLLKAILAEQSLSNKNKDKNVAKVDPLKFQPGQSKKDQVDKRQGNRSKQSRQREISKNKVLSHPPNQQKNITNQKKIEQKKQSSKHKKGNEERKAHKNQQTKNLSCQTKPDNAHSHQMRNISEKKVDLGKDKNKKIKHRKVLPQELPSQPRRSALWITVLLSGFSLHQRPSKMSITTNWKEKFDVLVMEKYSRTFKLLYSICLGIPIVNREWIIESERKRGPVDFEGFFLQSQPKDVISNSVKKVRSGEKVFRRLKFHLVGSASSFHLPIQQVEALIIAGGGQIVQKVGRNEDRKDIIFIVQLKYGSEQLKELKKIERVSKAYTVQLILDSCQKQSINWDANRVQKF